MSLNAPTSVYTFVVYDWDEANEEHVALDGLYPFGLIPEGINPSGARRNKYGLTIRSRKTSAEFNRRIIGIHIRPRRGRGGDGRLCGRFFIPTYNTPTEQRYGVVGATSGGRIIRVVYTLRDNLYRVVTAHDASKPERRRYKR